MHPPIDLFEDIADPADWPLLAAAKQKTNPRLMESIGKLDLVPVHRRVSGPGASFLMAPFTHVSTDRPSRFSDGSYGVLYVRREFETALFETMHHHARFMADTGQLAGWTSQFRELVLNVAATLHDCRGLPFGDPVLSPGDHTASQALAAGLRGSGADGVVYPSVRNPGGECAGLFHPDLTSGPGLASRLPLGRRPGGFLPRRRHPGGLRDPLSAVANLRQVTPQVGGEAVWARRRRSQTGFTPE